MSPAPCVADDDLELLILCWKIGVDWRGSSLPPTAGSLSQWPEGWGSLSPAELPAPTCPYLEKCPWAWRIFKPYLKLSLNQLLTYL